MPQSELETLLTWLDPTRKPLLVQLPAPEYARLAATPDGFAHYLEQYVHASRAA